MDADIGCSMSLTSLPTNAWRPVSPASSKQSMSSTFCPTCSSCAAFPVTSGPTTDLSSSPRLSKLGSPLSAPRLPISSGAVLGENGYVESFNARLRDELLNREIFYTLREAQIVIESWRRHYNTIRPHASPRRVAGCATPTSSAGHAGAKANLKLTFRLDHSVGADHLNATQERHQRCSSDVA